VSPTANTVSPMTMRCQMPGSYPLRSWATASSPYEMRTCSAARSLKPFRHFAVIGGTRSPRLKLPLPAAEHLAWPRGRSESLIVRPFSCSIFFLLSVHCLLEINWNQPDVPQAVSMRMGSSRLLRHPLADTQPPDEPP